MFHLTWYITTPIVRIYSVSLVCLIFSFLFWAAPINIHIITVNECVDVDTLLYLFFTCGWNRIAYGQLFNLFVWRTRLFRAYFCPINIFHAKFLVACFCFWVCTLVRKFNHTRYLCENLTGHQACILNK